ncbi:MAG: hypothetical protein ACFB13_22645 [Kiloniellaceae bacterium]
MRPSFTTLGATPRPSPRPLSHGGGLSRLTRTLLFLVSGTAASCVVAQTPATDDYIQNALCVDGTTKLCSTLPSDLPNLTVNAGYTPNTNAIAPGDTLGQINFDYFAWQMFVALNWPADGSAITTDLAAPRVWESYKTPEEVYPPAAPVAQACPNAAGRLMLFRSSKFKVSSFIEPFTSYPLIDSAGNFVLYDVRLNDAEAGYIAKYSLSTKAGQEAFGKPWDLPPGHDGTPGAIEIKTAWRIFSKDVQGAADAAGYFTLPATVIVPADHSETGQALCLEVTAGLVGMHIMQKITNPPEFSDFWVWGTFEHVRNAPTAAMATVSQMNKDSTASELDPVTSCPTPATTGDWSFFNAACTKGGAACTPNDPPPAPATGKDYLWKAAPPYAGTYLTDGKYGTQATRCWAIYETAKTVTRQFQTALGGSVWANYELVGTQWAQAAIVEYPSPLKPFPAPVYLTNTTLETYLQIDPVIDPTTHLPNQNASGSCITCHALATDAAGNDSNFSFLAGRAR